MPEGVKIAQCRSNLASGTRLRQTPPRPNKNRDKTPLQRCQSPSSRLCSIVPTPAVRNLKAICDQKSKPTVNPSRFYLKRGFASHSLLPTSIL
ncbi:hypothetical protein KM043_018678 [Ampulex compressa]|nr:hypothetical protein KM043_018678 [Ampulex compressa]